MEVISSIKIMQKTADSLRREGKRIGFVPTMGALHEGHLSLMKAAREENDALIVSIFVNPTQFGQGEDYEMYPKPLERDRKLCEQTGVDILFCPEASEMYPEQLLTTVNVSSLTSGLCGSFRPGHFQGVTTVVARLFHIVKPHIAYFGQKDYQQACIIKKMASDLNFDLEAAILPTVRDTDGLALSSRNAYLNPEERAQAGILFQTLQMAKKMLDDGERNGDSLADWMKQNILSSWKLELPSVEYAEVCDPETLETLPQIGTVALLALAVRIGKTRLIDNMLWEEGRDAGSGYRYIYESRKRCPDSRG